MNVLLAELGKKAAERWLTLLVLPGAFYLAAAGAAYRLGHEGWRDLPGLASEVDRQAAQVRSTGQVVLILSAVLVGSVAVGIVVQTLGVGVTQVWLWPGRGYLAGLVTRRRRSRWQRADTAYRTALLERYDRQFGAGGVAASGPGSAHLLALRNRLGLVEPARPTWMSDRIRAAGERVYRLYGLDLTTLWPRLWLRLPGDARADIARAQRSVQSAGSLAGWGLLYLLLSIWWWPAAVIGVVVVVVAWRRGRNAVGVVADLLESAVDVYGRDVAAALGLPCAGPLTTEHGLSVTRILRKGS
jgi:hypothetical protein